MIVIIQCAASKKPEAGSMKIHDGGKVLFVANPQSQDTPVEKGICFARPDDISDSGLSWREELLRYNKSPGENPLGLLPAGKLYQNKTYDLLAEKYGTEKLYILSAGWGLLPATFLTPMYDITFSPSAPRYKRRSRREPYSDFNFLPGSTEEPVVLFVSSAYVELAGRLTANAKGPRYLFYKSKTPPDASGCIPKKYETTTCTNWHYECAKKFLSGELEL